MAYLPGLVALPALMTATTCLVPLCLGFHAGMTVWQVCSLLWGWSWSEPNNKCCKLVILQFPDLAYAVAQVDYMKDAVKAGPESLNHHHRGAPATKLAGQ